MSCDRRILIIDSRMIVSNCVLASVVLCMCNRKEAERRRRPGGIGRRQSNAR